MSAQKICEGVYRVAERGGDSSIEIDGKYYYQIMDFFYIELPAEELSPEQVSGLCQARADEPRCFGGANKKIKQLFNRFLKSNEGKTILEIGAGTNPILSESEVSSHQIKYIGSDADNKYSGLYHFDASTNLPDDSLDVVIALFVLHFKFYEHQISQIYEHMKEDGIFLANVYNRNAASREKLKQDFENVGFKVEFIVDPQNTCRDHHYFFVSKDGIVIEKNKTLLLDLLQRQDL